MIIFTFKQLILDILLQRAVHKWVVFVVQYVVWLFSGD